MKKSDLVGLWNDILMPEDIKIGGDGMRLPSFSLSIGENRRVERHYADGSHRIRVSVRLTGRAVCVCAREEEDLLEEMHRRLNLFVDALPMRAGEEEVLYAELLSRPIIEGKQGGASEAVCELALTLRVRGKMRGMVPFLQTARGIFAPEGLFDLEWCDGKKPSESHPMSQRQTWQYLTDGVGELRFRFDRIVGARGQEALLYLSDRLVRGSEAILNVYIADFDRDEGDGRHACRGIPMTVQIQSMRQEPEATVFSGVLYACGRKRTGYLWQHPWGGWAFDACDLEENDGFAEDGTADDSIAVGKETSE